MCGKGKVDPHPGDSTAVDVYINDQVYWARIPVDVWDMTVGGYPIVKSWLSYREFTILGRPLQREEMTYVSEVVRRLKGLWLLQDDLDANYRAAAAETIDISSSNKR